MEENYRLNTATRGELLSVLSHAEGAGLGGIPVNWAGVGGSVEYTVGEVTVNVRGSSLTFRADQLEQIERVKAELKGRKVRLPE